MTWNDGGLPPGDDSHIEEWLNDDPPPSPVPTTHNPSGRAAVGRRPAGRRGPWRALAIGAAGIAFLAAGGWAVSAVSSEPAIVGGAADSPAEPTGAGPTSTEAELPEWASTAAQAEKTQAPFVGTLVGYGDPAAGRTDIRRVQIAPEADDSTVPADPGALVYKLHLVQPVDLHDCGAGQAPKAAENPRRAMEEVLPRGSRVLVIPSGRGADAFLHQLPESGGAPEQAPPTNSVNERLVETGTWEPVDERRSALKAPYRAADAAVGEAPRRQWSRRSVEGPNSIDGRYWPLILSAANTAITATSTGDACSSGFAAYLLVLREEERERRREQRELERQARIEAREPVYCIDGDGDGICFED